MARMPRQTAAWYDRLATAQRGYHYPWVSHLPSMHGEDAYLALVYEHLRPDADVLDVACGHGAIALDVAPACRSVLGYDRTAPWVAMATDAARESGIANARFVCHDSSADANGGQACIPASDDAFDLLLCSKGPFHWVRDARRVARPSATLLMLVPDAEPPTPWLEWLPESLRWRPADDPNWARPRFETLLPEAGLVLDSWRSFDVPEAFTNPEQLYRWLAWGYTADEIPSYEEVLPTLQRVFAEHGSTSGVCIRHRRYLWEAHALR